MCIYSIEIVGKQIQSILKTSITSLKANLRTKKKK